MFIELMKYKIIKLLRNREELIWSLAFPLILGSLFYFSFGGYSEKETFKKIDIGYVTAQGKDEEFDKVINELSKEGDNQLVSIVTTQEKDAKELLSNKSISGIIYNAEEVSLMVNDQGINESILDSFLNQYVQKKETISKIAQIAPNKLEQILNIEFSDQSAVKEISFTKGSQDTMITYFYALIAMSCLYGCFSGLTSAVDMKANLSALGARRLVAPTNKLKIILADFFSAVLVQFGCSMVTVFYLSVILKVDLGQKLFGLMLTVFVGCIIGIAGGLFVGSIGKHSEHIKTSIVLAVTMIECFLSGLMVGNMRDIIEHHVPIINRINPAALMVDSFYSLNIYDTYDRFTRNLVSMLMIAGILCIGSFLAIRRERYASI